MAESLESRLRQVREDFVSGLPARIAELLAVWDGDLVVADQMKRAHHLAHRLAGGAGTLGQPGLGTASKALELELQALVESGQEPDGEALARFRQLSADLADTIQEPT